MLWLINCIFMVLMEYMFGAPAGLISGIYFVVATFLMFRYVRFAEVVVTKQREEIERLRGW